MRKIIVTMFLSMDGVLQAPGGTEEDTSGQFKWGGWIYPYADDSIDKKLGDIMSQPFDLLLGRRTYEIFAAHWPYQQDDIGNLFNRIEKYVVSSGSLELTWDHSTHITGDVVAELEKLRAQDGPNLLVHGSSRLVQSLLAHQLVDELHTWIYPLTIGQGKRLFQEGTQPQQWKVVDTIVSPQGVMVISYVPAGAIQTGTLGAGYVSDAELARRKKHAND
ncbi:dihydrofolate reductase family protein [Chitinophaga rhizophila]|uniref:Dihydrofolate reductase family protein n=1 Tax=Chitinophaga rhizophila TaxID=2866212 RepID=A0ABS7G5F3_9BACT|nr:dihydrofolate reductase family protein [Chitinophaga rhizophila]MBW8682883.1 dihydrofolate reductase family protein [Chitinophaga rhizophila]